MNELERLKLIEQIERQQKIEYILIVLAFLVLLYLIFRKKKTNITVRKYDERQMLERAKGYKVGFFVLILFNVIFSVISSNGSQWISLQIANIISILIAFTAMTLYWIVNDAYLSINDNIDRALFSVGLLCLSNGINGAIRLYSDELFEIGCLSLVMSVSLLMVCIALFMKKHQLKSEEK